MDKTVEHMKYRCCTMREPQGLLIVNISNHEFTTGDIMQQLPKRHLNGHRRKFIRYSYTYYERVSTIDLHLLVISNIAEAYESFIASSMVLATDLI